MGMGMAVDFFFSFHYFIYFLNYLLYFFIICSQGLFFPFPLTLEISIFLNQNLFMFLSNKTLSLSPSCLIMEFICNTRHGWHWERTKRGREEKVCVE